MDKTLIANACVATSMFAAASATAGGTFSLASTMDADGFISEDVLTGSFAQISQGDGLPGDNDGLYDINDLGSANPTAFGAIDLFPREADFQIGGLTFASGVSGNETETVGIDNLDLSELWKSDPNRTNGAGGSPATVVSDISDRGLGLWFFDAPGAITFGATDATDTVTFTNGLLTSIDLSIDATFSSANPFGGPDIEWVGTFSISGDQVSFQINNTQPAGFFGSSTLVIDLTGTVGAVNTFVIPAPGAAVALGSFGLLVVRRRRGA